MNTTEPWLHIIGIGEDGMVGLSPTARRLVEEADVIVGGDRHHRLGDNVSAERLSWPSPFDAMISTLQGLKGRRAVVLVTGDPLWYSVGARIAREIDPADLVFHPQLSAFQWAACRMGWSVADVETVTVHGRPAEQIIPRLAPKVRMIVLTKDETTPRTVAEILRDRGYAPSRMTVLANLGGTAEERHDGSAADRWEADGMPPFHVLAIDCQAETGISVLPRGPGLPDTAFRHDGKMTKRDVRAVTVAKLWPRRRALLWDVGAGSGSVAIEWMRTAPDAEAIAIEPVAERRAIMEHNATTLGVPRLKIVDGRAPEALAGLPPPDAVFIGGGLSEEVFDICRAAIAPHGTLVINAVTLESEAMLMMLHARHGGDLIRLSVAHAEPVGPYRGWRAGMPVTQLSFPAGHSFGASEGKGGGQ